MLSKYIRTCLARALSVMVAITLAYSGSASGWNGLAKEASDVAQQGLRQATGAYTDRPTPIFRGNSPRRDPARSRWWTPAATRALESAQLRWQMEASERQGDVLALAASSTWLGLLVGQVAGDGSAVGGRGNCAC